MKSESLEEKMLLDLSKKIGPSLDDMFIKGLKKKGFTFENKSRLVEFVIKNCICKENVNLQKRIYYVNDVPFLLYSYRLDIVEVINNDTQFVLNANLGQYTYL